MAPLYHVSHEELKNMTIFSIVIEDVANNYRMPRENFFTKKKSVCDECCQLTYKKKRILKNVYNNYSMMKKIFRKMVLKM